VTLEEVAPTVGEDVGEPLECFRCARLRRQALLTAARDRGCSLLALGHHADDVVETWLLSMLFTGTPEVLVPRRSYFDGVVTLVRPAWSTRRDELARLHRLAGAPPAVPPCPREHASRRARVAAMLRVLGRDERLGRRQLFWAAVRALERRGVTE
jgi:tRNA(Ile)-lysidine synthase TilS/MesJ